MAENKSIRKGLKQGFKDIVSELASPDTWQKAQEITDNAEKERLAALDSEARKLQEENPNINALRLAASKKVQYAKDDEEREYWQNFMAGKTAQNKDGKVDGKNNNIQQAMIENGRQALLAHNAGDTETRDKLVNETTKTYNNVTKGAAVPKGDGKDFQIGDKQETNTNADDTETTLTKESAWNDYNKDTGTAKGLFENFKTLKMTAEEARKEFLSKVSTPSDAAKKAFKEIYGVDLIVTDDDDDDDDDDDKDKDKYQSSMYGIIDAMKNGDIDPSTGVYFMLDALSKTARNTGIDIGNIGAQFSGGTVRDDYQDSLWNQRRNKMFENEMTSEINKQEGTDKEMEYNLAKEDLIGKGLSNEQADLALNASRTFNDKAEEFKKAGNDTMADLYALVGSAATKDVGPDKLAAIAASGILNTPEGKAAVDEIIDTMTGLVGGIGNTFGGINKVLSFFTDWKNKKK